MQLIFVTGKKQSGKDTSYDFCSKILGGKTKCMFFADPLKEFLIEVFGLSYEQCYGSDKEKNSDSKIKWVDLPFSYKYICDLFSRFTGKIVPQNSDYITARQLMQIFGTEVCRKMYDSCWVNATYFRLNKIKNEYDYIFICDARFANELEKFVEFDPIVIRLLRNPHSDQHESEIALDNYNFRSVFNKVYYIDNTQMTLEEKNREVMRVINNAIL